MKLHGNLTQEKWFTFSFIEQMSNIGAEVGRAMTLTGNNYAFDRALELLDATMEDRKNHGSVLKELCKLKEALVDYFMGESEYGSTEENWNSYFYFFNAAASAKYF